MVITCVHVFVTPDHIQDFIEATKKNYEGTIREPGNLRFDFLQAADDPSRFMIYEVFRTQADVDFHKTTPHYLAWRDAVAPWMAKPREGIRYQCLMPSEEKQWKYSI